jgi:hypothetical protein
MERKHIEYILFLVWAVTDRTLEKELFLGNPKKYRKS